MAADDVECQRRTVHAFGIRAVCYYMHNMLVIQCGQISHETYTCNLDITPICSKSMHNTVQEHSEEAPYRNSSFHPDARFAIKSLARLSSLRGKTAIATAVLQGSGQK